MRIITVSVAALACILFTSAAEVHADIEGDACAICTCQNEAVICVEAFTETAEEQGPCAGPCSENGGFQSIQVVQNACSDLPTCDHAYAPAASPLWLAGGALGLLLFGGVTLRRVRSRS